MSKNDVVSWIQQIHEQTVAQDSGVLATAPPMEKKYVALRAAAQSLLTGDPSRLHAYAPDRAPLASWGSWMEGVPLAHALLFNEDIILDLVPAHGEADFVRAYHCLPRQFLDMMYSLKRHNRRVYFNLRSFNPANPETAELYRDSWDTLQGVLIFLKHHNFENCYVNAARTFALARLFDPNDRQAEIEESLSPARLRDPAHRFFGITLWGQLSALLAGGGAARLARDHPEVLVRGPAGRAQCPIPIQVFKRIAYHLTFSQLAEDIPADPLLHELAVRAARYDSFSREELVSACARATTLHHQYTAPLTGAYGGQYNLSDVEAAEPYLPVGHEARHRNGAFLHFLYGFLSDAIRRRPDGRLEAIRAATGSISLMQDGAVPSDSELRNFLEILPESAAFLRTQHKLEEALGRAVAGGDGRLDDVDDFVRAAESAHRNVNSIWVRLRGRAMIQAVGTLADGTIATLSAGLGLLLKLVRATATTFAAEQVDKVTGPQDDCKQIVALMNRLPR